AILLDASQSNYQEILFLPQKSQKKEFWEGFYFGISTEKENKKNRDLIGFSEIISVHKLNQVLLSKIEGTKKIGLIWHEYLDGNQKKIFKDANYYFKKKSEKFFKKNNLQAEIVNLMPEVLTTRMAMDEVDLQLTKKAHAFLTAAFLKLLKKIPSLKSEAEVAHYLTWELHKRTHHGLSFPMIVASGKNAAILHYNKNNDPIHKNDLVLIDFGIRYQNINIDVSRTIPSSGKFNPLQKILYQIVLDAQKLVEKSAKAGITITELNKICWDDINHNLQIRIIEQGGTVNLKYKGFCPHFVSHLIGYQTHDGDPFRLYRNTSLKKGNIISNEPGLYGEFSLTIDQQLFHEELGIRIEDNLLILDDTCENLTAMCPK
ncbi:MAG: M24 family metallopeptidase, partial [Candidatus Margulisiibacteriota bacterium]